MSQIMSHPMREMLEKSFNELLDVQKKYINTVPRKDFDTFCKEYIFDVLVHNSSFGAAFCKRFDIDDFILDIFIGHDVKKSIAHIEESGYILEE